MFCFPASVLRPLEIPRTRSRPARGLPSPPGPALYLGRPPLLHRPPPGLPLSPLRERTEGGTAEAAASCRLLPPRQAGVQGGGARASQSRARPSPPRTCPAARQGPWWREPTPQGLLPRQAGDPGAPHPTPSNIHKASPALSAGATGVRRRGRGGGMWLSQTGHSQPEESWSSGPPRRIQGSRSLTSPNPASALQTADEWSNLPKVTPLEHSIAQTPSQVSPP